MKNKTKFNVACAHCGKRDIIAWTFQFDVPKDYSAEMTCSKCGKDTMVHISLMTSMVHKSKKNK